MDKSLDIVAISKCSRSGGLVGDASTGIELSEVRGPRRKESICLAAVCVAEEMHVPLDSDTNVDTSEVYTLNFVLRSHFMLCRYLFAKNSSWVMMMSLKRRVTRCNPTKSIGVRYSMINNVISVGSCTTPRVSGPIPWARGLRGLEGSDNSDLLAGSKSIDFPGTS